MPEKIMECRSLCSNCRNAEDCCTFHRNRAKPTLYCEEFEIDICPSANITGKEDPLSTVWVAAKDEDSNEFIGLCSNCDHRSSCSFPKLEGGIWHCEEYE